MINTTDFLNALRLFEYVDEVKLYPPALKIEVKKDLLNELEKLKDKINEVDLGEDIPEIIN